MNKLIILDGVFAPAEVKAIAEFDYGDGNETWYPLGSNPVHEKILDIARSHFELTGMTGYEMWRNTNNPGRHVDKDEVIFRQEGRLVLPLCSAVYYPIVDNVLGGEFYTDDVRYFPKTNRLVLFSPGIEHGVSAYTGKRMAVSLNPWRERPRGR
ncbi:MAG TPA: hypothetical protein VFB13_21390 [Reyranella sp.]|nr:hypothetical protein [Reyranella sp.]